MPARTVNGITMPSVTQILAAVGLGPDLSLVPPDILSAAMARGSKIHEAIEGLHYGFHVDVPPEWKPYIDSYHRFVEETSHRPTHSELRVTNKAWGYLGHVDRIGWLTVKDFTGHRTVIDFKSGSAAGVGYQLAGYACAWNSEHPSEPIDRACAVGLRKDGTYRLIAVDLKAATQVWLAALTVFKARGGK